MIEKYEQFWELLNTKSHYEFDKAVSNLILKKKEREEFYKQLIKIDWDLSKDTFKSYFEIYSAERKTNQQDYTPHEVSQILAELTRSFVDVGNFTASDFAAGTGSLLIKKWWDDVMRETPWTYAPHRYFYFAQELGDNVIHYLIHNLAIRGMNAVVIHGDTLTGAAKQIYFIQNSKDDSMSFSDINVLPHNEQVTGYFGITEWKEKEIQHIESSVVNMNKTFPKMPKLKDERVTSSPKTQALRPWENLKKIKDVAKVERARKGKIYKKGSIIIQVSATTGEHGLLQSNGEVDAKYVVIETNNNLGMFYSTCLFFQLSLIIPHWFHMRRQGLNISVEDIENMPIQRF